MSNDDFEVLVPSASRLTENLRDLGYDFETAVADLIDNSISAGATEIRITIAFDGPDSSLQILDNGRGMSAETLSEAMRLGSDRQYGTSELGKFGMGLKTASLSQCRQITVVSLEAEGNLSFRQLDLDHVKTTNKWEVRKTVPESSTLKFPTGWNHGTIVRWDRLDRVLNFRDPWGGWAERNLLNLADRLEQHLGMVFSRFLDGAALNISINSNAISAWDAFATAEKGTDVLPQSEVRVKDGLVRVTPYVLPAKAEFSSESAWRSASGPKQWNQQQGFYIFRADRLIQSGGWSGLRTRDEHSKLARIAVEFWPDLDDAFEINISKMRVKFPEELRSGLQNQVKLATSRANARYRAPAAPRSMPVQSGPPRSTTQTPPAPSPAPAPAPAGRSTNADSLASVLEVSAHATGASDALQRIREHTREHFPQYASQIGW